MVAIHALSQRYGFRVIEDASHGIGGRYKNSPIGGCRYSDITVFSFHPVKIITTGEGGMATTNHPDLADRMMRYRSHGITSDRALMQPRPADQIWNYQQISLGYNYRMTDIQAALGLSQLVKLNDFINRRHAIVDAYNQAFVDLPLATPWQHPDTKSSYHLYPIRVRATECGKTQREIYDSLHKGGVAANLHYIPVYLQPYYAALGFNEGYCPEAESYFKETISLPLFPNLSEPQQAQVIFLVKTSLTL
jgi:dTDP-4-amino-4,6-dideoxygalactose transaminase